MDNKEIEQHQDALAKVLEQHMGVLFNDGQNKGKRFVDYVEKSVYLAAMRYCKGNRVKAEGYLGVSKHKLANRLDRYFKTRKVGYQFAEVE